MVICVLMPRFSLLAALGDRRALLAEPLALAPEIGRVHVVGEVSAPAEAFGIAAGMRVGEALSRCPELRLIPPDPQAVRDLWDVVLDRIESIGGEPESPDPGVAFFEADGLKGLYGGDLDGILAVARRTFGRGVRLGVAPVRFVAWCAASQSRQRQPTVKVGRRHVARFLRTLPISTLRSRAELEALPEALEQLGVRTLGELAELPPPAVAERFGDAGLTALDLARGRDLPLVPRRPPEPVSERLDLPEEASGQQLERALELLVARLLARRERRGRTLRALTASARLAAGGTWRATTTMRRATADPDRIETAIRPRLAELPAPADSLTLEIDAFGPPALEQRQLLDDGESERRGRLAEAIRQVRQAAGDDAAMRVLEVDPASRLPERRSVLTPFPDP